MVEVIWEAGLAEYDQMEGMTWRWKSIDAARLNAPLAQESVGPNHADRERKGSKWHLLVDYRGAPFVARRDRSESA